MMRTGVLPAGEPGSFGALLLPEAAEALGHGEPLTILGLADEETACGALAGYVEERSFRIVSLYVSPSYRRRGGARMMLKRLRELLIEVDAADGAELAFTVTDEGQEGFRELLHAVGFRRGSVETDGIYRTTLGEIGALPFFARGSEKGRSLEGLSDFELREMAREAAEGGAYLPELGLFGTDVDRECSVAVLKPDGLQGLTVLDRSCGGDLTVACAWCRDNNPALLSALLRAAFARAREKYPPETYLAMQAVTPVSRRLVERLLPGARCISYVYFWDFGAGEEPEPEIIEYSEERGRSHE